MNGNRSKCNNFFDWLSKEIEKQKELAGDFTKVYDFLENKRKSKANNEDFDSYIKGGGLGGWGAIDCKVANQNKNCNDQNHNNKYSGDGDNEIE